MASALEWTIAAVVAFLGPILTIFDLPGNSLILLTGLGFAFYDEALFFNGRLLSAMVLIYVFGECWEFCVSLFGIKREKVSWLAVFLIGLGGFTGTIVGTGVFPILGSFIGGLVGAFVVAFVYEYMRSGIRSNAWDLAVKAARVRFLALIGKLAAGFALAILLIKMVIFI